jgi:thioredoxin
VKLPFPVWQPGGRDFVNGQFILEVRQGFYIFAARFSLISKLAEVIMGIQKQFSSLDALLTQSPVPVLVDFTTEFCGPCRMMNPILEQVQSMLKSRLQIVKLDSEKYPELSHTYRVHALPTLILFKGGKAVGRMEGLIPPERLLEWLQPLI